MAATMANPVIILPLSLKRSDAYDLMNINAKAHAYGGTVIRLALVAEL